MNRRELLAGVAGFPFVQTQKRNDKKPNVVFFLTDDHGAWAVGPWGCPEIHTPNLAALAEGGTRFDRAYASTPVCSPSRATYLTGTLPSIHGVQDALMMQDLTGRPRFVVGEAPTGFALRPGSGEIGPWT